MSFNAYFGAFPIVDALRKGAQIVVTGRCADSALVLGPLIYEFGWKASQYDLLSAGSLAGHIIECACQATGGNFTDWKKSLAGKKEAILFFLFLFLLFILFFAISSNVTVLSKDAMMWETMRK